MNSNEFQAQTARVEQLVERVSALADGEARSIGLELLQSLMDLHGAVISRMVEVLSNSGEGGRASLAKLGSDPLICGLLVLYGVHPASLEERVKGALEKVSAQLRKQGGSVELIGISDAVVRVKIGASGQGCHSSPDALKTLVEQAILEAAPEVVEIVTDGVVSSGFVPLNMIQPATTKEERYEESAA